MTRRLVEQYELHDLVEVDFGRNTPSTTIPQPWIPAVVVGFAAPGIWVELLTGQQFFVTNTRKIRPKPTPPAA